MNWSVNPFRTNLGGALRTGLAIVQFFYFFCLNRLTNHFSLCYNAGVRKGSNSFRLTLQKGHANGLSRVFYDTVKYQNLRGF